MQCSLEPVGCTAPRQRPDLGELSSATSGSLTVALRAAASELRGTGLLVRHEREQAPTASSGTTACPGVATLLLNARSRRAGCLLASTSGAPGGCSDVALAMRPMLVARGGGLGSCPNTAGFGISAASSRGLVVASATASRSMLDRDRRCLDRINGLVENRAKET